MGHSPAAISSIVPTTTTSSSNALLTATIKQATDLAKATSAAVDELSEDKTARGGIYGQQPSTHPKEVSHESAIVSSNVRQAKSKVKTSSLPRNDIKATDQSLSNLHLINICNNNNKPSRVFCKSMQSTPNAARRPVRFLIASLGNPSPYQNTRHSAGHILLKYLQSHLGLPSFIKSKPHGGPVSQGTQDKSQWTLFQSPSYMNTSGIPVLKAYREFLKTHTHPDEVTSLVILHDEMELAPSHLKLRRGMGSAKGHNGIKSVQQSFHSAGLDLSERFIKLGIGIGRPENKSRESSDISDYVLAEMTSREKNEIHNLATQAHSLLETEMDRLSMTLASS